MELAMTHILVGIVFVVAGLNMGTVARRRSSKGLGIRLPQTLKDQRVWKDVHLASRPWWLVLGVLEIAVGLVVYSMPELQEGSWFWAHVVTVTLPFAIILAFAYAKAADSEEYWRKHDDQHNEQ